MNRTGRGAEPSLARRLWDARSAYLYLLPGLLAIGLFLLLPIAQTMWLSLFKASTLERQFIGIDNYVRLAGDPVAQKALQNTILFVLGIVPATVVTSLILAVGIESSPNKARPLLRAAFYLPAVAGGVVLSFVWRWMFNPAGGILPWLFEAVGLKSPIFLGDPDAAIWALSLVAITFSVGPTMLLFMAGLAQIPPQLSQAAKIDGASSWQVFRHVTVPLLRPVTFFVIVITTIGTLQIWDIVYLMTEGGPAYGTTTLGYLVYKQAFGSTEFGYASAIGVVLMVFVAIVAVFQFRFISKRF